MKKSAHQTLCVLGLSKYKVPGTAKYNVEDGTSTEQWLKGKVGF
jgi:hypothetical protein